LQKQGLKRDDISEWCVHPCGKKILEAIEKSLSITREELSHSYRVLRDYGNMSSATILFVLKDLYQQVQHERNRNIFAMAFGPGLTLETFTAQC
jgi:predicted naringenin-chalcone synthase